MVSRKSKINIALVQMNSSDDIDENYKKAADAITRISNEKQVDLVVFPENFLYFGSSPTKSLCDRVQKCIEKFCDQARAHKLSLLLGTVPVPAKAKNKYFSRCYLVNSVGELFSRYDKRHLFDVNVDDGYGSYRESETYEPGTDVVVSDLQGTVAKLGLSICFDLRFSEHFLALVKLGANALMVPSAFTYVTGKAHWEVLLRARAIETQSFVLACNQVGNHSKSRQTFGHSLIIDPWGRVLANAGDSEGICYGSIDLDEVATVRKNMPLTR